MTDRVNCLFVALDRDIREDDVEHLVNAIRALRYVLKVEMNVVEHVDWVAGMRIRRELRDKLYAVLEPDD
jgi:uncharacterized protein YlbG (UPF0298 family)